MTDSPSTIQGEDPPHPNSQTNGVIGPPEVDSPGYGGQLWPTPPGAKASAPVIPRPPRDPEPRKQGPSGRSVGFAAVLLAVVAATFAVGLGIGAANARREPVPTQPGQTYDAGFADGARAGRKDGYATGLHRGRAKGFEAGRKHGYQDGYSAGRAKGFRTGWIRGCQSIFDELETSRVIDRVPGPGERYWYLTRDQC